MSAAYWHQHELSRIPHACNFRRTPLVAREAQVEVAGACEHGQLGCVYYTQAQYS